MWMLALVWGSWTATGQTRGVHTVDERMQDLSIGGEHSRTVVTSNLGSSLNTRGRRWTASAPILQQLKLNRQSAVHRRIRALALLALACNPSAISREAGWTAPSRSSLRRVIRTNARSRLPRKVAMATEDLEALGVVGLPLEKTVKNFKAVPDQKLRYQSLLFLAKKLPEMDQALQIESNRVQGCQSVVYVHAERGDDGIISFQGTSDSQLTKGLCALLVTGLAGATNAQIQNVKPEFIQVMGLAQSLTPGRNNGFLNMLALMKRKAAALEESHQ